MLSAHNVAAGTTWAWETRRAECSGCRWVGGCEERIRLRAGSAAAPPGLGSAGPSGTAGPNERSLLSGSTGQPPACTDLKAFFLARSVQLSSKTNVAQGQLPFLKAELCKRLCPRAREAEGCWATWEAGVQAMSSLHLQASVSSSVEWRRTYEDKTAGRSVVLAWKQESCT